MKKFVYVLMAAAAVLACNKNDETVKGFDPAFSVSVEGAGLTSGFAWSDADRVAVYSFKGERVELVPTNIDGAKASFSALLTDADDYIPVGAVLVYPASRLTAEGTVAFPAEYAAAGDMQVPTLAAEVSGSSLVFKSVAGTLKVTVPDLPPFAESIVFSTCQSGDSTQPVACAGTFHLSFEEGAPVLSVEEAGPQITVPVTTEGPQTYYLPLPAAGGQDVWMKVNYADGELYNAKVSLTGVGGSFYASETLALNPSVYLISDFTSWDYENACPMEGEGSAKTATLGCFKNQYYSYRVVFSKADGEKLVLAYGPSENNSESMEEVLSLNENNVKIVTNSVLTFAFDYFTGENTVTDTGNMPQIYLTGSFQATPWSLNSDTPLAMASPVVGYGVVTAPEPDTKLKAYVNPYWGDSFGDPGNGDNNNQVLAAAGKHLVVASCEINVFTNRRTLAVELDASAKGPMYITGDFNEWGTPVEMTRLGDEPLWYYDAYDWPAQTCFSFVIDGQTKGACSPLWSNTGVSSRDNKNMMYFAGSFRIIAGGNCDNRAWAVFKLPS